MNWNKLLCFLGIHIFRMVPLSEEEDDALPIRDKMFYWVKCPHCGLREVDLI